MGILIWMMNRSQSKPTQINNQTRQLANQKNQTQLLPAKKQQKIQVKNRKERIILMRMSQTWMRIRKKIIWKHRMKILKLKCPKCKNTMNYQAKTIILSAKRKTCVYCGKTFKIKENIIKKSQ